MGKINANTKVNNSEKIKIENEILGLSSYGESSDDKKAYIALKYFDKNFECFSEWQSDELACFSNFVDKVNSMSWKQLKKHTGIRYKDIDVARRIPGNNIKETLSKDITFCEMRVTEKARVVGFRRNTVFFICWLDRSHRICPI